ncbi:hypothetical protein CJ030_MR4G010975 [Morella rubra]|uniref:Uncharacterized protein n=1 Tax=Morella rubra TaxID=262757 RepID=A0A6A1VWD7_9ROSI|nr:hypothetical protein CJ030_MR4G010975 [Morella rubra]
MRRESPINVDRRHEEEFPLWFRNRDDVMPAGGNVFGAIHQFELRVVPRRSAINKENRAKLKIVHTSGARSFQRARALLVISSVDLSRKLEEARLQIEEMRARQLEYEALLVKVRYGADDARASADDGGAATEERRRADADDGRAATKKRRRAPEDDGGAAKDPSGTTRTEDATNGGADA